MKPSSFSYIIKNLVLGQVYNMATELKSLEGIDSPEVMLCLEELERRKVQTQWEGRKASIQEMIDNLME